VVEGDAVSRVTSQLELASQREPGWKRLHSPILGPLSFPRLFLTGPRPGPKLDENGPQRGTQKRDQNDIQNDPKTSPRMVPKRIPN